MFNTNGTQAGQYYFTFNTSGQNIVFYNRQPPGGHNMWWDNSRIFHADTNRREITNLNGTVSAPHPQSGPVDHLGLSPNRALIVGDSRPGSNPVWVRLYEKANATPLETLYSTLQTSVVWDDKVHTNASFSRDGTKIYCNKPVSSSSARLLMNDISSYT